MGEIQPRPIPRKNLIKKELKELYRCMEKKQHHIERWKVERIGKLEMELQFIEFRENLLLKAKQKEKYQQDLTDSFADFENNNRHENILSGMKMITGLIERFNKTSRL